MKAYEHVIELPYGNAVSVNGWDESERAIQFGLHGGFSVGTHFTLAEARDLGAALIAAADAVEVQQARRASA